MIEINNKKYAFRFQWKAIKGFLLQTGLALSDLSNTDKLMLYAPELLYNGILSGERTEGRELTLTLSDIENWMDEDMDNLQKALEAFQTDQLTSESLGE